MSKRRSVRQHPPHRKKRRHHVEEEEDDVETMIAKTRRRMQASASKDGFSIPREAAIVPRSSPAIPVEAASVSKEPRIAKKPLEIDEVLYQILFRCHSNLFIFQIQVLEVPPKIFELVEIADDDKGKYTS